MATYYDASLQAHKDLLPPEQRAYADLANLATECEKDVIEQFTERARDSIYTAPSLVGEGGEQVGATDMQRYVRLRGYKADSAHADVDADLKDALKRTIADVLSWRIERRLRGQALSGTSVQGVSRAYIEAAAGLWPRGWDRRLRTFDLRIPAWGI